MNPLRPLRHLIVSLFIFLTLLTVINSQTDECDPLNCATTAWKSDSCYPDTITTCAYYKFQRCAASPVAPCIERCNFTTSECATRVFNVPTCGNKKCEVGEVGVCNLDCGFYSDRILYNDTDVMMRCPGMMNTDIKPNGWRNRYYVLTFDDGPSNYTSKLLDILKSRNVTATFFIVGANVEKNTTQSMIRRMLIEGHIVGSHTYSHFNMSEQPRSNILDDAALFDEAWDIVMDAQFSDAPIMKYKPRFFRPPYGSILPEALALMKENSFEPVMWNFDVQDWAKVDNGFKILEATQKLMSDNPGDAHVIYLGHDLTEPAVDAIPYIIEEFAKKNYTNIGLDECLYGVKGKSAYAAIRDLKPPPVQKLFVTNQDDLLTGDARIVVPGWVSAAAVTTVFVALFY